VFSALARNSVNDLIVKRNIAMHLHLFRKKLFARPHCLRIRFAYVDKLLVSTIDYVKKNPRRVQRLYLR